MSKRILSLLLTFLLVFTGILSTFAVNPEGSVPNGEIPVGFYNGVQTQYYDVTAYEGVGHVPGLDWSQLKMDTAATAGSVVITNGKHSAAGVDYALHKASKNSFFVSVENDGLNTKDAFRHSGYIYLKAGTSTMSIDSDDGFIFRIDSTNPNGSATPAYNIVENKWVLQSVKNYQFDVNVSQNGYYLYQLDYFNWGGDGSLQWQIKEPGSDSFKQVPASDLYLYTAPTMHTLTVTTVGNGTVTVSPDPINGQYVAGTEVTLTATPGTGWSFNAGTGITGDASALSFVMDANKNVTVTFTEDSNNDEDGDNNTTPPTTPATPPVNTPSTPVITYPLTVNVEGPGTALPGTGAYSANSIVQFSVQAADGATFVGWFGENGGEVSDNRILMDAAKTVTARFEVPAPAPSESATPSESAAPVVEETVVTPEPVAEAAPTVEPTTPAAAPAAETADETLLDQSVAQAAPELPKTGGLPLVLLLGLGTATFAGGLRMKKR